MFLRIDGAARDGRVSIFWGNLRGLGELPEAAGGRMECRDPSAQRARLRMTRAFSER